MNDRVAGQWNGCNADERPVREEQRAYDVGMNARSRLEGRRFGGRDLPLREVNAGAKARTAFPRAEVDIEAVRRRDP
jgi:hypothetical protein